MITKFHNLLVIALVIIRRTHKAHKTDRGAENPTGPKLPDFTLCHLVQQSLVEFSMTSSALVGDFTRICLTRDFKHVHNMRAAAYFFTTFQETKTKILSKTHHR